MSARKDNLDNPEYYALLNKECGEVPEGENQYSYYYDRFNEFTNNGFDWEAVMYFSDEIFEPENYNEKSIKRESHIAVM